VKNDELVRVTSIEEVAEYIMDISDDYCNEGRVAVVLRREDALKCFNILTNDYSLDVLLAIVNTEKECLHYVVTIGLGDVSIEPIHFDNGVYPDTCVDYMLIEEDVSSAWLIQQSCDNLEILTFDEDCDEFNYPYCKEEIESFADFIDILDTNGELSRLLKYLT